ncbi:hypothetical protein KIN20_031037 [Parelaphostrongylus tenuis]|uniref:Uncharacterized protein n=1 Tax=Parelaphostrongylus tenuis TaxID=148309 RepID=A0AAD5R505_PARTN|nr:hypothetical protein KIN20_031037 [Parelaphostrongylus tenuis]
MYSAYTFPAKSSTTSSTGGMEGLVNRGLEIALSATQSSRGAQSPMLRVGDDEHFTPYVRFLAFPTYSEWFPAQCRTPMRADTVAILEKIKEELIKHGAEMKVRIDQLNVELEGAQQELRAANAN